MEDLEFEIEFEFPKSLEPYFDFQTLEAFNIKENYYECLDRGIKGKLAIEHSLENHFEAIRIKAKDLTMGLKAVELLQDHIDHRIKNYSRCIAKSTDNYLKYLKETYNRQLCQKLRMELDDWLLFN